MLKKYFTVLEQRLDEAEETRKRNAELEVQAQKTALQLVGLQQTTAELERQVRQALFNFKSFYVLPVYAASSSCCEDCGD
jgi:Tfp pilus assembly protein PilO